MRHRRAGVKLNRTTSHRNAMFRNMVTSLFKHDRIRTTETKAKELRRWVDHLVTLAKRGDLHARRQAMAIIREKDVVHKLFEEAKDRFGAVAGGYTRLVKIGFRSGDAAPMLLVELVTPEAQPKKKKKKKKAKAAEAETTTHAGAKKETPAEAAPAGPSPEAASGKESVEAAQAESEKTEPETQAVNTPEEKKTE